MHCSVWRFVGDRTTWKSVTWRWLAEGPESNHAPRRSQDPDGLLIFDTCPSEEVYRAFFAEGGPASALFEKHGLVPTTREDYPVIRAFGAQSRLDERERQSANSQTTLAPRVFLQGFARAQR